VVTNPFGAVSVATFPATDQTALLFCDADALGVEIEGVAAITTAAAASSPVSRFRLPTFGVWIGEVMLGASIG
jgi:hypothetical protein